MSSSLFTVEEAARLVTAGGTLLVAGEEALLAQLPAGRWIGGTIPYFMSEEGGGLHKDRLLVTSLSPAVVQDARVVRYDAAGLARVYLDTPRSGFTFLLIPAGSDTHLRFALEAPGYERFASRPLLGWITGVELSQIGRVAPKAFDGTARAAIAEGAVALHVTLPPGKAAEVGIVNIFEPGDGEVITFPESGFSAGDAFVNGARCNLAAWARERKLDTRLPLVTDYCGARVNISFQEVGEDRVRFYAPVFAGVEYRHARPVGDYLARFAAEVAQGPGDAMTLSCNCILNYLYSSLEGKRTGKAVHPFTFGEIAYQLLNQTLVYLTISG